MEWQVCGEASTGSEAILKAKRLKPDVIVMDISMPEIDGLKATRQIHAEMPKTPVLILTMHESDQLVREMLDAGARGYVLKSDLDQNLFLAIRALRQGNTFFSAKVSAIVLGGFLKDKSNRSKGVPPKPRALTPRQVEVVRLLAEGKTNKEVADALGIATKTVEVHARSSAQAGAALVQRIGSIRGEREDCRRLAKTVLISTSAISCVLSDYIYIPFSNSVI